MANNQHDPLTPLFTALADPTRRAVIDALLDGPLPVSALAEPHDMALPSFLKHVDKLEAAGVITTRKEGRVRTCQLCAGALGPAETWLSRARARWSGKLDRLAAHLDATTQEKKQ
ncbi:MAG: metalloregulator ArsR/SmtB family transcription factor [Pseudomonadota bacterium]